MNYKFVVLGVISKKKTSIFKDIVQMGGREVNPISKNWKEMNFWQKLEREGVTKHIKKNIFILYSGFRIAWFFILLFI